MILPEWLALKCILECPPKCGVLTALAWLVPHETAAVSARSVYTIHPCTMSFHAKLHRWDACVFSCNLPPALLAEWPGSFTCYYCGNTGVEMIRNTSKHRKLTPEKKSIPPLCGDSNPRPFNRESGALTTELSPLSQFVAYQTYKQSPPSTMLSRSIMAQIYFTSRQITSGPMLLCLY